MRDATSTAFTLGFVGLCAPGDEHRARAYEDAVVAILPDHGARVVFRGHREGGESSSLPVELHVLWFPSDDAYQSYLADPRRAALLAEHGEVFTQKTAVRLETVSCGTAESTA